MSTPGAGPRPTRPQRAPSEAAKPPSTESGAPPPPSPLARYAALSFAYFATIGLFNPYAPLWFQALGLSTLTIGSIASLQSWTRVLAPYGWGWLGDHRGRRERLIRLAAAGAVLSALALLGVREAGAVALVTMLLFLANGGVVPLYEASLAQLLSSGGRIDPGRYGRVRVWGSVGFIASVTACGVLLEAAGIAVFPVVAVVMNVLMLVAALRLPATAADAAHGERAPPLWPQLRRRPVQWFFASVFFTVLAHSTLYAFFSLYLVAIGYGKAAVGALWAVAVGAEIVFFWFQGHWFARLSAERWLLVAALATAVRFAGVAEAGTVAWVLVWCQALHAISFAAHHGACIALVHQHFPGRLRGRGQALYSVLGYGVPGVLGGVGGGWLIEHLGFQAAFRCAVVAALLAAGCAHAARRRQPAGT